MHFKTNVKFPFNSTLIFYKKVNAEIGKSMQYLNASFGVTKGMSTNINSTLHYYIFTFSMLLKFIHYISISFLSKKNVIYCFLII